jgi:hypothetical protein
MLGFRHSTFTRGAHLLEATGQPEVYGKVVNYRNEVADQPRSHRSWFDLVKNIQMKRHVIFPLKCKR